MSKKWVNIWTIGLSITLLTTVCAAARLTAEKKPVVTISFAGYDALKSNAGMLGKIVDRPALGEMLDALVAIGTQGMGLQDLDKKQPWGATIYMESGLQISPNMTFPAVIYLPVKNINTLIKILEPVGAKAEKKDDVYAIEIKGNPPVYAKQKGAWVFLCGTKDDLAIATDAPEKMLGDLPQKYLLAANIAVKNVPSAVLDGFVDLLNQQVAQRGPDVQMLAIQLPKLKKKMMEVDDITVGLKIDDTPGNLVLDVDVTAKPGTNMAKEVALLKSGKTSFSGLLSSDSALAINTVGTATAEQAEEAKRGLDEAKEAILKIIDKESHGQAPAQLISEFLAEFMDVVKGAVDCKKNDGGMAVYLGDSSLTLLVGSYGLDGAKMEKLLLRVVDLIKAQSNGIVKEYKLNAESHEGFTVHRLALNLPDRKIAKFLGAPLDVYFAFGGDKQFYVAVGKDALAKLKAAIDKSKQDGPKEIIPSKVQISLDKIVKFIGSISEDEDAEQFMTKLSAIMEKTAGKNHISLSTNGKEGGVVVRLEVEEGVIKAINAVNQIRETIQENARKPVYTEKSLEGDASTNYPVAALFDKKDGKEKRLLGYSLGTMGDFDKTGEYTTFVAVEWSGPDQSLVEEARKHNLKLLYWFGGKETMDAFARQGIPFAKKNQDVVAGVYVDRPGAYGISPEALNGFGQKLKAELPKCACMISFTDKEDITAGYNIPKAIDGVVLVAMQCTTIDDLKSRASLWEKGIAMAGDRPVLCRWEFWSKDEGGLVPACEKGFFRELGNTADQLHLRGIMFSAYSDIGNLKGVSTRPELVEEIKELGKKWQVK